MRPNFSAAVHLFALPPSLTWLVWPIERRDLLRTIPLLYEVGRFVVRQSRQIRSPYRPPEWCRPITTRGSGGRSSIRPLLRCLLWYRARRLLDVYFGPRFFTQRDKSTIELTLQASLPPQLGFLLTSRSFLLCWKWLWALVCAPLHRLQ